ncbi:hypothetical protein CBR_g49270 [Chara braunii]|uniref:Uncharacterized protein n=1 Tax=Chara braunii TaxID=69332 RepID=A0A388M4T0_CHABU|nr:hypothetical protein CBR_g49270 [Chara braunii]|eukprot:GBG89479.1 hypothetical protein CBR_g49270 [Chara braunii]
MQQSWWQDLHQVWDRAWITAVFFQRQLRTLLCLIRAAKLHQLRQTVPAAADTVMEVMEEKKERQRQEEEQKRKEAEEENIRLEKVDKDSLINRMGEEVRSNTKLVCETVLGRKFDLPAVLDPKTQEIARLQQEVEDLNTQATGAKKLDDVERLRKEKEELLGLQEQKALEQETEDLKGKRKLTEEGASKKTELGILKEVDNLRGHHAALEKKNEALARLKHANKHLEKEFVSLVGGLPNIGEESCGCRDREEPTWETSGYEAEFFKERLLKKLTPSARTKRPTLAKCTTPRNLRKSLNQVVTDIDSAEEDDEGEDGDQLTKEAEQRSKLVDKRRKELHLAKKSELELICNEEGISYIKIEQARTNIVEIHARRDFDELREEMKNYLEDEDRGDAQAEEDAQYATSAEEVAED